MRFWPIHINALPLLLLGALLLSTSPQAGTLPSVQEEIDIAISPSKSSEARVAAAKSVTEGWQESLPTLIRNIEAYYEPGEGKPYSDEAMTKLVPLTDLLVTIVVNKDGAVQRFRETDTAKTIDLLAWAAGSGDRSLRFNASYILFQVVDDDNLCIILHRLRDPKLGYSGRNNLLRIAIAGASAATLHNVKAAYETAVKLKHVTEGKSAILASTLADVARKRGIDAGPTPDGAYCAHYDVDTGVAAPIESSNSTSP
jgi:hypothetical protein